ncbi:MAG: replicative DNA helicase, partial [Methylococcaceae bacterium]
MSENYSFAHDPSLESYKLPPHSIQAEQSVLGGLMLDNEVWDTVADKVSETDFYHRSHQLIYKVIADLANKQIP